MREPKPLLREGASDFERQLLSAVMRERPSPQLRSRMRQALGLTGPLVWASSVKAMLVSLAGKTAVGAVVAGLIAAGTVGIVSSRDGSAEPAVSPGAAVAVLAAPPAAATPAPPAVTLADERALPAAAASGELREEIRLLDQARAALQRGSRAQALGQLDRYRERFPSGVLSREASVLRQRATATPGRSNRTR